MVNWEMKINLINSKNSPKFSHVLFGALNNLLLLIKLVVNLPLKTYFKPVLIPRIAIFVIRFCIISRCGARNTEKILKLV